MSAPLKHPLDDVRDTIEADLHSTGFSPLESPPGKEPKFPKEATSLSTEKLRQLYDDYLSFYEYLTDKIIQTLTYLGPAQAKLTVEKHKVTLEIGSNKAYGNAEMREAAVGCHPTVAELGVDVTYFKTLLEAQEERRKKMSKAMERLYREIMVRTEQQTPQFPHRPPSVFRRL